MCLANEQEQKQVILRESLKVSEKLDQNEPLYRAPVQITDVSKASEEAKRQAEQLSKLQLQTGLGIAHADRAADGAAVQHQAPARKTYKARRAERKAEKRRAKEAAEKTGGAGNIVTYDIQDQLKDYNEQLANSYNSYFASHSNLSGVDDGVLQFFSHGFRTDKAGNPATPDDLKYQQEDEAFYDVFCSTDYKKREPYLQRMVEEVLSLNLEDMFSDHNMQNNAAAMRSIAGRMVSMDNVVHDENNSFFIGNLPVEKREALAQAMAIGSSFSAAFTAECHRRGVDTKGFYIKSKNMIQLYSDTEKNYVARYQEKLEPYQPIGAVKRAALRRGSRIDAGNIWGALAAERPAPGIYQQIRGLLEPDVQKLLNCEVKDLRALSDKDLRQLYAASLDVNKCLTLKHPEQSDYLGVPLTLKDDLIGQRSLEFEYKLAVLRGLVERADGFKEQGKQTIKDAARRYRNQMTIGTEEFRDFFEKLAMRNPSATVVIPAKFDDIKKKFWESSTGEFAEAMKRVHDEHYFSLADLAYSEEELKKQNRHLSIGEALFRSFDSFLKYEAAQTLLTPEQFEQMVLNLGAGAYLTRDSSVKDRNTAIEKNNAGLDTLREVLTAQYDMLERKYGNSIEKLTIRDIMEHYLDMEKDFANTQVDFKMATRFPGFIRKDNRDDERLFHRIQYYNVCGISINGIISFIGIGRAIPDLTSKEDKRMKLTDKNLQKYISYALKDVKEADDSKRAKEYLTENSSGFQHPLDWSQKVKNPADAG